MYSNRIKRRFLQRMITDYEQNKKISGFRAFRVNTLVSKMQLYKKRRVFREMKLSDAKKLQRQKAKI